MAANDKYKDLAVDVEKLGALVLNYHQLVKAAQLGDRSIITEKNQLRKELLMQLERIAKRLEYRYEGADNWIVDSGMELLNDRVQRTSIQTIAPPFNLKVENSKGRNGELLISFKTPNIGLAVTHAVEYSYDDGQTWNNGTYGSSRGIWLRNLVPDTRILVRVRSVGRRQEMSAWSEVVKTLVL